MGWQDTQERDAQDPAQDTLQSVAALHLRNERAISPSQRLIESTISFVGRPRFLAVSTIFVMLWVGYNRLAPPAGLPRFDKPPFGFLQGFLSLSALFLTIMILIAQNRQALIAERRAQLDLQISLLADQKSAKIIQLLEELRRDLPQVRDRADPEAERLQMTADPEAMLVALDYLLSEAGDERDHDRDEEARSLRRAVDEVEESVAELQAASHAAAPKEGA